MRRYLTAAIVTVLILAAIATVHAMQPGGNMLTAASPNATPVAVNFATNPVSIPDNTTAATTVTAFTVVTANGSTYTGTPTIASCSQSPCPLVIAGSTGAWTVATSSATLVDASGQTFVVQAGSISGTLSYNITSGAAPTPPTQATVANFTTCIVCFDFTASSGGVFLNGSPAAGVNPGQTNTWLECAGASNPIWYQNNGFPPTTPPCPTITTDGGAQVLQIVWRPSDSGGGGNGIGSGASGVGIVFPGSSFYSEGVMRWTPNQQYAFANGPWTAAFNGCSIEWDGFENTGPGLFGDAAFVHCGDPGSSRGIWSASAPPNYPGFDIAQYHAYGLRVTTDAATGMRECVWIDNILQGCQTIDTSVQGVTSAIITTTPGLINLFTGTSTCCGSNNVASNFTQYIKHEYLWSCSNWQSSNQVACKTSTLSPGGY